MHLTLTTLGSLQAATTDAEGNTRTLGRGKPVAMLAYLACIPGLKASREHLAALLWGDVETDAARQNLRQTVWYLKKKLGEGLFEVSNEMLALVLPFSCDRDLFLQAAQRADFATAVQRHTGAFIPDFAAPGASEFEQWCELERRRLTVTFLRCADALARQWLSEGKFRDAQELARRARDVDPMDQATWRLLLETLIAGSDGLGATSEAEHFEAFLAREESEPEAATITALRAARHSPAARTPGETGPSASIAAELVGREAEFSHILAAWEQARGGTPRVVAISAAAGLGKSRLLRDVQARLRASRARCVLMRANPGDRHLSGGFAAVVASGLAELPGAAAISTASAGVLVSLAPALSSVYASATPDTSEGEEAVRRRALALVDLMHAVSDEHPAAILLDDLHWADEHSARVLAAALSRLEHAGLLVVLTKRPVADPRALFTSFEQLALPPLDLAAVTSFVSQVAELPAAPWADVLPQQLLLATGGSPLLLVETLHDALEQGKLSVSEFGAWQCDDPRRVTDSLREGSAVQQRAMRLAPAARRVLLALALVGRPIELDEALEMVGDEADGVREHVETLERGGFVLRHGTQLQVAHDEIADAVAQATPQVEQRAMHSVIARAMLVRATDEIALRRVVEHASAAGDQALVRLVWQRFLVSRRRAGDRRATRRVAADLLGRAADQRAVVDLMRSTPWRLRQRARWLAAAGLMATVTLAATAAWRRTPVPLTSDFTVWTVDSTTGGGQLVGVRLPRDFRWDDNAPIEAKALDASQFPSSTGGVKGRWERSPNAKEWWAGFVDPVLGDEFIFIDSLGRRHLPMANAGDDGVGNLSPDGRQFAGLTARFDTITDHMHIVTGDLRGGTLRRLTFTQESDRIPSWRPDGTQLAFQRMYYTVKRSDQLCLVDVDGTHERCLRDVLHHQESIIGWMDERRLLVASSTGTLTAVDASTGLRSPIGRVSMRVTAINGSVGVGECVFSEGATPSVCLFPTSDPAAARPVRFRGAPLRGAIRHVAPTYDRRWIDTLRLEVRPAGYALGISHPLLAHGSRANGAPAWLHDLRWLSRDTAIATVDSTGRLRPRRVGTVWIVVSAGGWRTDSAHVRIVAAASRPVLAERWTADWESRWQPFGVPAGIVVPTPHGPALLPNGDGSYGSGAYLRKAFPASNGAGIEAEVSLLVTASQWQTLIVEITDARRLEFMSHWDHRTGDLASGGANCAITIPGAEGASFRDHFVLLGKSFSSMFRATPTLLNGSWHRIRLQYLPDGRCALALDAKPLATTAMSAPADSLILVISGNDRFGGRLLVGPLDIWSGVRRDIDWSALDADSMPASPRRP